MDELRASIIEEIKTERMLLDIKSDNIDMVIEIKRHIGCLLPKTIFAIRDHFHLLRRFLRMKGEKFTNLRDAILSASDNPNKLILYFAELDLYGVYLVEVYYNFFCNLRDDIQDYDCKYTPIQIIQADCKQKLIFNITRECTDTEKIIDKAKEYFQVDVRTIDCGYTEVTVDILLDNLQCATTKFEDFIHHLKYKVKLNVDYTCIRQPVIEYVDTHDKIRYFTSRLPLHIDIKDICELAQVLKSGNCLQVNNNRLIIAVKVPQKMSEIEWIKQNPPIEREPTHTYYERYVAAGGKKPHNTFGRIVVQAGFKPAHTGNLRYYQPQ